MRIKVTILTHLLLLLLFVIWAVMRVDIRDSRVCRRRRKWRCIGCSIRCSSLSIGSYDYSLTIDGRGCSSCGSESCCSDSPWQDRVDISCRRRLSSRLLKNVLQESSCRRWPLSCYSMMTVKSPRRDSGHWTQGSNGSSRFTAINYRDDFIIITVVIDIIIKEANCDNS